jgi:hypothetical protein
MQNWDEAHPETIVSCQELRDGFEVRALMPTKIGTGEEGIHEHVSGEAKLPAVIKTLCCSFCQLRSMCLSPIPSYFTEYGGGGDLVLLGSIMRPSIDHSDTSHQPTYLIATPLTSSNVKVTKYEGMRNNVGENS